ncbi:protein Jumonji-like [Sitophilus oryzae]|uniref:Protein Jumonji-like n=1 Tax=Sitophilus oryzae TaxID=7048 RepID=A0A6J2XDS4_SITOR|nr:protein Jumonji-like [Sitophilus oryzae]
MKRKRKDTCPSPILDESPKRTKVQAQRKFAQNSGVHSPVITPIRDLEPADLIPHTNVMPLPMKRPNTEDFLTFLCFRGTPILPPNLQFFNTASIVTDGQVHEIKGDSPKNGPIDIAKCAAGSSEKPFIAFGVRKRADPIVISRQMERKRRHALALQALRRKYQEQKMAKIRALTISKLSEKTTNKTLVKTNTIQKTETVTKKTNTLQKTKVIATKHVKVTTQTLKTSLKPKVKPKMCLRSFRGKFVQKELPFKAKRNILVKETTKKPNVAFKKVPETPKSSKTVTTSKERVKPETNKVKQAKQPQAKAKLKQEVRSNARITRSGLTTVIRSPKIASTMQRPQVKRRILIPSNTVTVVKPKLRSTTLKKTIVSRKKAQQRMRAIILKNKSEKIGKSSPEAAPSTSNTQKATPEAKKSEKETGGKRGSDSGRRSGNNDESKKTPVSEVPKRVTRKDSESAIKVVQEKVVESKKEVTKNVEMKKEVKIAETRNKKEVKKNVSVKKEINLKTNTREVKKNVDLKKTIDSVVEKNEDGQRVKKDVKTVEVTVKKVVRKSEDRPANTKSSGSKDKGPEIKRFKPSTEAVPTEIVEKPPNPAPKIKATSSSDKPPCVGDEEVLKPPQADKNKKKIPPKEEQVKKELQVKKDEPPKRKPPSKREDPEQKSSARPSRKTKEAAAIYMELLSHKLVNESQIDDDNVSIDSFPELPNVKRTEQREIELKAQAKSTKDDVEKESPENAPVEEKKVVKKAVKVKKEEKVDEVKVINEEDILKKPTEENTMPSINTEIKIENTPVSIVTETPQNIVTKSTSNPDSELPETKQQSEKIKKPEQTKIAIDKKIEPKPKEPIEEPTAPKRQTRLSAQTGKHSETDSSDESFHADVRIPRKKKLTRSAAKPVMNVLETNVDIILEAARVLEAEKSVLVEKEKIVEVIAEKESDSDESTTSDINLKSLQTKQRNKKLSKTKSSKGSQKSKQSFSDSDEEPLSKLTSKKTEKPKPTMSRKTADKSLAEVTLVNEPKPKRECTKRPSNYLPMLSSSEEDAEPYFLGFDTSKEDLKKSKTFVQSLVPSLDLLNKDIGRKGKVNMSNEQIEQWLKDSAMAGSVVAKENDAMPKFGEIPETKPVEPPESFKPKPVTSPEEKPKSELLKSPLGDRKWIFKKDKKDSTPNKNAFSPDNECSVYAFGEENEDVICTPFRRPSRRPSSTATSKSEDELSKNDDTPKQSPFRKPSESEDARCFNIPLNPTKPSKVVKSEPMVPPSTSFHGKRSSKPLFERVPEPFDDGKYKIPSSPSASSGSSAKLYKKPNQKQKGRGFETITPVYVSDFPKPTDPAKFVEAPVFHPTEQEFQDPLEYIERIRHKAEQFGICKIVPPTSFKPECKVSDDMRFTAYNQYVHKMLHRWGPNFKEFIAIRKYLATQNITLKTPPWIGGMEVDLPRLYQTVQSLGGLKEVIEKKKWPKVSDNMKIPKSAQDRVTKLDDIYCKYLLPYDTLSPAEREKLFDEVETYWAKRESKNLQMKTDQKPEEMSDGEDDYSDDNEAEECTIKGKNMALNAFYRIARNTMSMYFKVAEPSAQEVEQEFWRYVTQKQNHICVHSASIDCGNWGYGFPVSKNSPFARHPWNLKVLTNNNGSVLRSLGPVMGVTVPTLHVGMVFSTCCWYRDPHGLPWVEYLHTGGAKIWYGIPSSACEVFHAAMQKLVPNYCRDKELWLPSDTAMVPPGLLMEHNVSLCRTIQEPGQFLVVFPKVFTSSISTGYVVSESVYFAPLYWLRTARNLFNDLKTSCEPSMFSLDKLLISIANDSRSSVDALRVILPFIEELSANEKEYRSKLRSFGKIEEEKITPETTTKKKKMHNVEGDFECEVCRINLHVSMVIDTQDDLIYCLEDAVNLVAKNTKMVEKLKLKYTLDENELGQIPGKITALIETKLQKKVPSKYAGMPTMLK